MHTTDYAGTFIRIAEDCPVATGVVPPLARGATTVAGLQHGLLAEHPYELTSDDVLFAVFAERSGVPEGERAEARLAFFAKPQACLRSSPLGKRYGWGIHHDAEGRVAIFAADSPEYRAFAGDPDVTQLRAMRSRRA